MVFFLLSRNCYGKGTKDWDGLDDDPFPFLCHVYYCQSYQGIFFGPATITTHQKWQGFVIFQNLFSKHDMSTYKQAKPLKLILPTDHFSPPYPPTSIGRGGKSFFLIYDYAQKISTLNCQLRETFFVSRSFFAFVLIFRLKTFFAVNKKNQNFQFQYFSQFY